MKITKYSDVLVVLLAVVLCWSLLAPAAISGDQATSLVGGCKCNYNESPRCARAAGAKYPCMTDYQKANGSGSKTPTYLTYCTGAPYCDETTSLTCP